MKADGKAIEQPHQNHDGEVCAKCKQVGADLLVCSVSSIDIIVIFLKIG